MDEMGVRYLMWLMRIWVVTRDPHDNVLLLVVVVVIDRWRHNNYTGHNAMQGRQQRHMPAHIHEPYLLHCSLQDRRPPGPPADRFVDRSRPVRSLITTSRIQIFKCCD